MSEMITRSAFRQKNRNATIEREIRDAALFCGAYWPLYPQYRPQFTQYVINYFFNPDPSNSLYKLVNNTPCFLCKYKNKFGKIDYTYLHRLSTAPRHTPYATIGHKIQWREFVAANADIQEYEIHIRDKKFIVEAYKQVDVERLYNDLSNLQLESNEYNSSKAYSYPNEDPLQPTYHEIIDKNE